MSPSRCFEIDIYLTSARYTLFFLSATTPLISTAFFLPNALTAS
jgi:hypothetical protein